MAGALKADLDAQLSQSIASDLEATRAHNERINARHDLRRGLADLGSRLRGDDQQPATAQPPSDGLITGQMLRDFQRQQGGGLAQPLLAEVMRELTTMQIPAAWANELAPGQQERSQPAEPRMAKTMVQILGRGWQGSRRLGRRLPAQRPQPRGRRSLLPTRRPRPGPHGPPHLTPTTGPPCSGCPCSSPRGPLPSSWYGWDTSVLPPAASADARRAPGSDQERFHDIAAGVDRRTRRSPR